MRYPPRRRTPPASPVVADRRHWAFEDRLVLSWFAPLRALPIASVVDLAASLVPDPPEIHHTTSAAPVESTAPKINDPPPLAPEPSEPGPSSLPPVAEVLEDLDGGGPNDWLWSGGPAPGLEGVVHEIASPALEIVGGLLSAVAAAPAAAPEAAPGEDSSPAGDPAPPLPKPLELEARIDLAGLIGAEVGLSIGPGLAGPGLDLEAELAPGPLPVAEEPWEPLSRVIDLGVSVDAPLVAIDAALGAGGSSAPLPSLPLIIPVALGASAGVGGESPLLEFDASLDVGGATPSGQSPPLVPPIVLDLGIEAGAGAEAPLLVVDTSLDVGGPTTPGSAPPLVPPIGLGIDAEADIELGDSPVLVVDASLDAGGAAPPGQSPPLVPPIGLDIEVEVEVAAGAGAPLLAVDTSLDVGGASPSGSAPPLVPPIGLDLGVDIGVGGEPILVVDGGLGVGGPPSPGQQPPLLPPIDLDLGIEAGAGGESPLLGVDTSLDVGGASPPGQSPPLLPPIGLGIDAEVDIEVGGEPVLVVDGGLDVGGPTTPGQQPPLIPPIDLGIGVEVGGTPVVVVDTTVGVGGPTTPGQAPPAIPPIGVDIEVGGEPVLVVDTGGAGVAPPLPPITVSPGPLPLPGPIVLPPVFPGPAPAPAPAPAGEAPGQVQAPPVGPGEAPAPAAEPSGPAEEGDEAVAPAGQAGPPAGPFSPHWWGGVSAVFPRPSDPVLARGEAGNTLLAVDPSDRPGPAAGLPFQWAFLGLVAPVAGGWAAASLDPAGLVASSFGGGQSLEVRALSASGYSSEDPAMAEVFSDAGGAAVIATASATASALPEAVAVPELAAAAAIRFAHEQLSQALDSVERMIDGLFDRSEGISPAEALAALGLSAYAASRLVRLRRGETRRLALDGVPFHRHGPGPFGRGQDDSL